MKVKFVIIFLLALAGFAGGFFVAKNHYEGICVSAEFRYINRHLGCSEGLIVSKRSYIELKGKLEDVIAEKIKTGEVANVSIYFRDLQFGPTLGIGEQEKFAPASLLKLPLFLTYINLMNDIPELNEAELYYRGSENTPTQTIFPKESIQENIPYSVDDLMRYMIKYSDNRAYVMLLDYLAEVSPQEDLLKETFIDLGIVDPQFELEDTITVKSYASIFTQLYHSSFLQNKELSEKALALLADTDFDEGLVAGVPSGTEVAHKFGERSSVADDLKQLHDCGIVYYSKNPYALCIMTRGNDNQTLAQVISSISKMVYEEFDSRKL